MIELVLMGCCHQLHTITHKVTIKAHEQTTQSDVMRRNVTGQVSVISITE
jgi:hypothetical protein